MGKRNLLLAGTAIFIAGILIGKVGQAPAQIKGRLEITPTSSKPIPINEILTEGHVEGAATDLREKVLVTRVVDGDTIKIAKIKNEISNSDDGADKTVRLIGMNAPEVTRVECYGKEATRRLGDLVLGKEIETEKDVSETDRYGRLLRFVWLGDVLVNEALVMEGFARVSTYPPDVKYQERITRAEKYARERNLGLWGGCGSDVQPTSPNETPMTQAPSSNCLIKGNVSGGGKIYHLPRCGSYAKTSIDTAAGERWFCSEEEAVAAGWRKAKNCP